MNPIEARIAVLLEALATAFGGRSQFGAATIGAALAGQINNNGWGDRPAHLYITAIAAAEAERWEWPSDVEAASAASIESAFAESWGSLGLGRTPLEEAYIPIPGSWVRATSAEVLAAQLAGAVRGWAFADAEASAR